MFSLCTESDNADRQCRACRRNPSRPENEKRALDKHAPWQKPNRDLRGCRDQVHAKDTEERK